MGDSVDRVMGKNNNYDAVFTDKKDNAEMDYMDFLKLMVAQMQNQDFTSPMDNSQMITQMTQFSNMQQMEKLASYSQTSYAMSMVGKTVTASRFTVGGELDTTTGAVQKVSLVDNEYVIYVDGKKYTLDQIMSAQNGGSDQSVVTPGKYKLEVSGITKDEATVKWPVPTEDEITAKGLKYTVYYSKEEGFDTVEAVEKGKMAGNKEQKGIYTEKITGLEPDTKYYVNIVVTDENGIKSVYKPITLKTAE